MNRLLLVLLTSILAAAALACGGDSGDNGKSTAAASPTRAASDRPTASLNPKSGPPGVDVTASGSGWPPGVEVAITGLDKSQKPYTTTITNRDGSFSVRFFLEKKPDGSALETGAYEIVASSGNTVVTVPYVVEVRRPVSGPGPGGG
jgi:hypothetical protein